MGRKGWFFAGIPRFDADNGAMIAFAIGILALVAAVVVVVAAARRHQNETGDEAPWSQAKSLFIPSALGGVREESAILADPENHATDVRITQLFTLLGEDGDGYLEPRDLLDRNHARG